MDDAQLLFEWRNDPATRAASHNTAPLDFDLHLMWLKASLGNDARRLYVAMLDGVPVGTIRADLSDVTELSWTVAPQWRGRGVGTRMVALAAATHSPVRAEIKSANIASQRIAEKAGLVRCAIENGVIHYRSSHLQQGNA